MKKIIHFCAGLEGWNGMANTAIQMVEEQRQSGEDAVLTNMPMMITGDVDEVCIHGAWLPVLWGVAKKAKRIGARLCIRPAGSYDPVRLAYHGWKKRLVSFMEHRMLRRADVLLATCEAERRWISSYVGKSCPQIETIDLKRFFRLDVDRRVRAADGVLHLLYLGRRHPLKGIRYLEAAVNELMSDSERHIQIELRIVSNAFGEDKERVWDWCDALVLPTMSENFGRVVAEALEHGKVAITTDGAPAWDTRNNYGGRLVYLRGYRNGSDLDRVRLLMNAIDMLKKEIDARRG